QRCTIGSRATFLSWATAASSIGTPRTQALMGTPPPLSISSYPRSASIVYTLPARSRARPPRLGIGPKRERAARCPGPPVARTVGWGGVRPGPDPPRERRASTQRPVETIAGTLSLVSAHHRARPPRGPTLREEIPP